MNPLSTTLLLATLACATATAMAAPLGANFTYGDWEIVKQTGRQVLNHRPDGKLVTWSNPESGSKGNMVAQQTSQEGGTTCRSLQMEHVAGGQPETQTLRFCRQPDGTWRSQTPGLVSNEPTQRPNSVMFQNTTPAEDALATIPAAASTDECEALSRSIQGLEGRPQQRFAAIQRYEAECKRP